MKKSRLIILIALLAVCFASVVALSGCSGNKIEEVRLEQENISRSTYVQGQELDLDNTYLTVTKKNGKTENVALSGEGVTVDNYDKNTLGEQSVVIEYEGAQIQWKVTVIARMVVSGYTKDYVVGDSFNYSKGNVTVANDDGTTFSVKLGDEAISVSDFNTEEEALPLTVKVSYTKGGANYSTQIKVNVYAVDKVDFSIKNLKTTYYTHEKGIDLSGGYLKWEANSGKINNTLTLSEDMVKEGTFDLSKATPANRTDPYVQHVTLQYAGFEKSYDIFIYYSGVTVMNDAYESLKDIEWTEDMLAWADEEGKEFIDVIGEEKGTIAVDAMEAYASLKDDQKSLVSSEVKEGVARVAAIYGRYKMLNALYTDKDLNGSLELYTNGQISLKVGEKSAVEYCITALTDTENVHDFVKYGKFLMKIKEEFANVSYLVSENLKDKDGKPVVRNVGYELSPVYTQESLDSVIEIFNFMLDLDEALSSVPENWQENAQENKYYETAAQEAVMLITEKKYSAIDYAPLYDSVSSWRKNDDYFDIVYTYYLNANSQPDANGKTHKRIYDIMDYVGSIIPLPDDLQAFYYYYSNAYAYAYNFNSNQDYLLMDTFEFMYLHNLLIEISNEIFEGTNEFYKELYEVCGFKNSLNNYVERIPGGYYDLMGAAIEDESVKGMWKALFNVVELFSEAYAEENVNEEKEKEYFNAVAAMLEQFVNLSPASQYTFVVSMQNKYADYNYNVFAFEVNDEGKMSCWNNFSYHCLLYYYDEVFDGKENAQKLFVEMFKHMETYFRCWKTGDYTDFAYGFEDYVIDAYNNLSEEERDIFNSELGKIYNIYLGYCNDYNEDVPYEFGAEWTTVINGLKTYASEVVSIGSDILPQIKAAGENMNSVIKEIMKEGHFAMVFAAYEISAVYEKQILECENAEFIDAYYREVLNIGKTQKTLQGLMLEAKEYYYEFLTFLSVTITNGDEKTVKLLYDYYKESDIGEFFAVSYPILKLGYSKNATVPTKEQFVEIIKAFGELSDDQLSVFNTYGAFTVFFNGVKTAMNTLYADEANAEIKQVITNTIDKYVEYLNSTEETKEACKTAFIDAVDAMTAVWESNSNEDFTAIYEFFVEEATDDEEETPAE